MSANITVTEINDLVTGGSIAALRTAIDRLIVEKKDIETQLAHAVSVSDETRDPMWRATAISALRYKEQGITRLRRRLSELIDIQEVVYLTNGPDLVLAEIRGLIATGHTIQQITPYQNGLIVLTRPKP